MHNTTTQRYDVIIAGGGLAALISGILLTRKGYKVGVLEKREYPFHKVCGEYVSNEVLDFLLSIGFDPFKLGASRISQLTLSDVRGNKISANLDLGGFGLSRFSMDHNLARLAESYGVEIIEGCRVNNISFRNDEFLVESTEGNYNSNFVIGAYGKRDLLDKRSGRKFIDHHTGYMGVKYHVIADYPANEIGLYHFPGGYCGITKIEGEKYNLCYLYKRNMNYKFNSVEQLQEEVLFSNRLLKTIFKNASFVSEQPEVINEIYFEEKECVNNHILYCGDSAGLITPLCGNGMAMAIHGAVILCDNLENVSPGKNSTLEERHKVELNYNKQWSSAFANRLYWGRQLQKLSGKSFLTSITLKMMKQFAPLKNRIIRSTHGDTIAPVSPLSIHQSHQTLHQ